MRSTELNVLPVRGVRVGVASAGIKQSVRPDIALFEFSPESECAAVFTKNAFCAAPVVVAKKNLKKGLTRFWIINSGNANAGTGLQGIADAEAVCAAVARVAAQGGAGSVLPFSTGVIGEPLRVDKIERVLPDAVSALSETGWHDAARAIMTTDTVPKGVSRRVALDQGEITITGIAKGSGMICPDMATMLSFIGTDAKISGELLQQCLNVAVARSFNRITVDGDTSTNDACALIATGQAASATIETGSADHQRFQEVLIEVCEDLARAIVRDGEGATKLITIEVEGGENTEECLSVAYAIAHSPLVKTAFFASDANWGRILAAVGRAGLAELNLDAVQIYLDDVCIVRGGGRAPDYSEEAGARVMAQAEITICVELGRGSARERIWTCDFSFDYVRINAEYRT